MYCTTNLPNIKVSVNAKADNEPDSDKGDGPSDRKTIVLAKINIFNMDSNGTRTETFDSDGATVVLDNSATGHICNDKSMFVDGIQPVDDEYVATINGKANAATGIGTVEWTWLDDDGRKHTYRFEALYFS